MNANTNEPKDNLNVDPNVNSKWFKVYAITGFNSKVNRIDQISRYLFPSGFVFCVVIYLLKYAMN